jgi:hypothetical protein
MKIIKEFKNFNPHPENKFPQLDDVESNNDELSRKEMEEPLNVVSGFEEDELEDMSDDELEDMYAALEKDVEKRNEGFIKSFENFEFDELEGLDEAKKSGVTASLKKKSKASGIPMGILRKVFSKGMQAWNAGHRPGVAQHQWGMGRVNSFITGSGGARKADADLWKKAKAAKARKKKKK